VAPHLPEFAGLQVLDGGTADAPQLRAPRRPLTLRHLLTHTAGFGTGGEGIEQASELLRRAHPQGAADLREFASRVARVPLAADPGTRFRYDGVQIEVLGRVIEVAAGMPLAAFLQQRLFGPLKMVDTGFEVPPAQRRRIVDISTMGPRWQLVLAPGISASTPGAPLNRYPSGAGGLYSTAADFARLCRMLLGQGTLDGVTILGRKTVETMLDNHLWQTDPAGGLPPSRFSPSQGFGLGGSVVVDPAQRGRLSSIGAFGWSGAASTYFTVDPKEQLAAILLMQHLPSEQTGVPDLPRLADPFYNLVYQALTP
jgi:CubicO group peptidase (beta-lactamase class C family)